MITFFSVAWHFRSVLCLKGAVWRAVWEASGVFFDLWSVCVCVSTCGADGELLPMDCGSADHSVFGHSPDGMFHCASWVVWM